MTLLATYTRFELLRTLRNRRFLIFAFGFPIVLYFLTATPNRGEQDIGGPGLSAPLYYMVSLVSFGAMTGMLAMGGRIADERSAGWNRQLSSDSIGPAIGGATGILAFLGGAWFPLGDGILHDVGQVLPSYWLVQASRVALGGEAWGAPGWLIVAAWTLVLTALAARAYRRDTARA